MKLSVIIPAYNEDRLIAKVINEVEKVTINKEIIVVNDFSSDTTINELGKIKLKNLKVISHPVNQGKGAAIRTGIKKATGDIIIIQDADLEYNPQDYHALIEPITTGSAQVVYGSRFKGKVKGMAVSNFLANKILTCVANLLYQTGISDEATCYKVFKSEILKKQKLQCNRFDFCPEITAKLAKQGIKITEVPITYQARSSKEGKKIRFSDGFSALWTLVKFRFTD